MTQMSFRGLSLSERLIYNSAACQSERACKC